MEQNERVGRSIRLAKRKIIHTALQIANLKRKFNPSAKIIFKGRLKNWHSNC